MSKRDLLAVGLRVYGVVIISIVLIYSPTCVSLAATLARSKAKAFVSGGAAVAAYIGPLVLGLALGAAILLCAESISRLLLPQAGEPEAKLVLNARDLLHAALATVGVVVLVGAVIGFVREAASSYLNAYYHTLTGTADAISLREVVVQDLWVGRRTAVIVFAVSAIIGLVLVLRPGALAGRLMSSGSPGSGGAEQP